MTVKTWLRQATQKLDQAGIGTARLDALVLLEDVTGLNRASLLAQPDTEMSSEQVTKLKKLLNRRATHQPLAYVRGQTEFYGHTFVITTAVLEPRPESETMIELLKKLPDLPAKLTIADVGAGSGALGITAQLELPKAQIELLEIDAKALKVAQINVDLFTLNSERVRLIKSDLLKATVTRFDVLLCNLPYVPDSFQINQAAQNEPKRAIFGGPDGLTIYRKLFNQVTKRAGRPLYILTEALPPQHTNLQEIAQATGYQLQQTEDFIQVFRKTA